MWIGWGQCIEQHGTGEPYLPLLEALGRLGRTPDGARLVVLLHQYAPSWLVHLPALVPDAETEALWRRAGRATRERMLRELAEVVEALTTERPLVLVLEDLHWSDVSTLDWLAYMARRREAARLLVLGRVPSLVVQYRRLVPQAPPLTGPGTAVYPGGNARTCAGEECTAVRRSSRENAVFFR
jgi:hypothetical protein